MTIAKKAMEENGVFSVVFWPAIFSALAWLSFFSPQALGSFFYVDFNGTNLSAQLLILIKGLAMTASWLFAYSSVRQLPLSFSGAVKASGPIWTLMGGMLVFSAHDL